MQIPCFFLGTDIAGILQLCPNSFSLTSGRHRTRCGSCSERFQGHSCSQKFLFMQYLSSGQPSSVLFLNFLSCVLLQFRRHLIVLKKEQTSADFNYFMKNAWAGISESMRPIASTNDWKRIEEHPFSPIGRTEERVLMHVLQSHVIVCGSRISCARRSAYLWMSVVLLKVGRRAHLRQCTNKCPDGKARREAACSRSMLFRHLRHCLTYTFLELKAIRYTMDVWQRSSRALSRGLLSC